ncbi:hypothetical protein [Maribacter hydrothermalis]|uniref:GlsB/YeaQ/YmgE family stress response membrane protein n=1 Tax=Maribacter hydrothermalis TaxID=1836467 RepID=A0A1B7YZ19_9FLAO|nr:hypothetical protein [Maribacter hydrothermalis]APQ16091.1 hypothetical protein BTR34_01460 [Maribacter hydrothermalis]OBR35731.1 hypothetical protein A9200_11050 [Maribacter hydrothermalis]
MTGTLISLLSILIGIVAANVFGNFKKNYSFGVTGNTVIGVFGSILCIKTFGRLGFNPWSIMNNGDFNGFLLIINLVVSAIGGAMGLVLAKMLTKRFNKS